MTGPHVGVFRPDDDRLRTAVETLRSLGVEPVPDPMLAVEPTGRTPAGDDWVVFTSKTGVELAVEAGWSPGDSRLAAIGSSTAAAIRAAGWSVSLVPDEYSSAGLVSALTDTRRGDVAGGEPTSANDGRTNADDESASANDDRTNADDGRTNANDDRTNADDESASASDPRTGRRSDPETTASERQIELARSDHGSAVLPDGLRDAGIPVRETTLYRLVRPPEAGESAAMAANGQLDGAAFTSSLTVEHFLEAADERASRDAAIAGLNDGVVGAIGEPTARRARTHGIDVSVVPDEASFDRLAERVVRALR